MAIPKNKICWVRDCDKEQADEDSLVCKEHLGNNHINSEMLIPSYVGDNPNIPKKKFQEEKRLNQTVRAGRAHGKNINKLRSKMKNGQWHYEYIK